jgi:branched-subunit amino acid ABC-type transport system permease component
MLLPMISTIGLSFAIQAFIGFQWGQIGKTFPPAFPVMPFSLGGVILVPALLWIGFIGAGAAVIVFLFLRFTSSGMAMRSVALDRTASSLLGIPVSRSFTYTAFASGALAAIAGILIAPVTYMQPTMGLQLSTLGFVAALIGGLGSIHGAFLGGLLLGVAQNVAVLIINPSLKDVVAYVLLAVFLVVRPTGLFGEEGLRVREV